MKKLLLKRILFEVFEDIARIDLQLDHLEVSAHGAIRPYVQVLRQAFIDFRQQALQDRALFLKWFETTSTEAQKADVIWDVTLPQLQQQIRLFGKTLMHLNPLVMLPETSLFLSSLQLNKLLPGSPDLVVLPVWDKADLADCFPSTSVVISPLPALSLDTPLRWLGLLDSFLELFCRKTTQITTFLEELGIRSNASASVEKLIVPLLSLRLLGPAYYPYYVLKSLQSMDFTGMDKIEPMLFQELNRFGLVSKDLVILHQTLEQAIQYTPQLVSRHAPLATVFETAGDDILKVVERVIPERLAFTEKAMQRTQLLGERLENDLLICAVPTMNSPLQLLTDLHHLEEASVYPLLKRLEESPATPREIMNAGWLYKLEQSSDWLYELLQTPDDEGWDGLKQHVQHLDQMLLKSIEVAEVHRVLASAEIDSLPGVPSF